MSSLISQNMTDIEAVTGCTFACICHTVFRMFPCLQINCQSFYLHPFDWLIEIYLQTEVQGTHHNMVSLQPVSAFSPLFYLASMERLLTWQTGNCAITGPNESSLTSYLPQIFFEAIRINSIIFSPDSSP